MEFESIRSTCICSKLIDFKISCLYDVLFHLFSLRVDLFSDGNTDKLSCNKLIGLLSLT